MKIHKIPEALVQEKIHKNVNTLNYLAFGFSKIILKTSFLVIMS